MSALEALPLDDSTVSVTASTGTIEVDSYAHIVRVNGAKIDLTPSEFALVELMASEPRRCWTYSQLGDHGLSTMRRQISRVRAKLGVDLIETVWGVGYRFLPVRK